MYLLDTNVISELRKIHGGKADRRVARWADGVDAGELFVSVLTLEELERGMLLASRRDRSKGEILRTWLESRLLPEFEDRILSVDVRVARRCAALHVPNPRSPIDALIAATALVHGLKMVTRNVSDFAPTGVEVLNPWQ